MTMNNQAVKTFKATTWTTNGLKLSTEWSRFINAVLFKFHVDYVEKSHML